MSHFISELPRQLLFTTGFTAGFTILFFLGYLYYRKLSDNPKKISSKSIILTILSLANISFILFLTANKGAIIGLDFYLIPFSYYSLELNGGSLFMLIMTIFSFVPLGSMLPLLFKKLQKFSLFAISAIIVSVFIQGALNLLLIHYLFLDLIINAFVGLLIGYFILKLVQKIKTNSLKKVEA